MQLAEEKPFQLGAAEVRPSERALLHPGGRETLEPRVMEVLVALARAGGAVVSRDALVQACWGGRAITDDAINRVISRLRRIGALTGGFSIETITKVGYRLTAGENIEHAPPTPAPRAKRPVLLAALIASAAALLTITLWAGLRPTAPRTEWPLTLAVMPFDAPADASAIADGLPREIRNRVARLRGLRVIADSSSFAIAGERLGATEIGQRLRADLLLDGGARIIVDGAVRITIELVDAKTGAVAWTNAYEGPARDLSAAEGALSTALLEYLVRRLGPERVQALAPPAPIDGETYRLILEARQRQRQIQERFQTEDIDHGAAIIDETEALVRRILARAPENAEALVMLSALEARGVIAEMRERPRALSERRTRAVALLRRAIRSDPDNPAALTALAEVYRRYDWRWSDAEPLYRRALAIDPNYADAHLWLTYLLSSTGRCREALQHARIAASLDPEFTWRRMAAPRVLKCLGRFEEADRLYRAELDRDPANVFLVREIYLNHMQRRDAAGLRALARHIETDLSHGAPSPGAAREIARMRAGADALEGRRSALDAMLDANATNFAPLAGAPDPMTQGRFPPDLLWMLAVEAAAIGETERAMRYYERAIAGGSVYIPETLPYGSLEFTPVMRAHPRYQAIWRNDSRLGELARLRLTALRDRQMAGVLPDGARVRARPTDWTLKM